MASSHSLPLIFNSLCRSPIISETFYTLARASDAQHSIVGDRFDMRRGVAYSDFGATVAESMLPVDCLGVFC